MEYKVFGILHTARLCGIPIDDRTLDHEEIEASCPFCGDRGSGKYHLSLNREKNVYRCNLCGAAGNSVTLYAHTKGLRNREAVDELSGANNIYPMPIPQYEVHTEPSCDTAPPERRNEICQAMLTHLTLSDRHKDGLLARGLSAERIERNGYRSLPASVSARRRLAAMLSAFHDLKGVPGFYMTTGNTWSIYGKPGLLVPVRDIQGRIQGFQVRLDDESNPKRKYRWLSSRHKKCGARSYSWLHVTGNRTAKRVFLTEGGLKGDVASFLDDDALFICLSGINALGGLKSILKMLQLEELVLVLDMDKVYNPNVQTALNHIQEIVADVPGLRLHVPNWNPAFKGIDDYYFAKMIQGYRPARYQKDTVSEYLEQVWANEYPDCDREFITLCPWEQKELPVAMLKCVEPTKPSDIEQVEQYRQALRNGAIPFPPLVCINSDVAEGRFRYWAYRMEGREHVQVIQNKPPMAV